MQGKVMSEHSAPTFVDVGIDVCKALLDVHILPAETTLRVANTKKGHKQLLAVFKDLDVRIVVLEATGKHHQILHRALHAAGVPVAVVNPLRARLFAESLGALAKTDTVDARMLAVFGGMARLAQRRHCRKTWRTCGKSCVPVRRRSPADRAREPARDHRRRLCP